MRGRYRGLRSPPQGTVGLPPRCGDDTVRDRRSLGQTPVYPRDAGTIRAPSPNVLPTGRFTPAMRGRYSNGPTTIPYDIGLPPRCGDDTFHTVACAITSSVYPRDAGTIRGMSQRDVAELRFTPAMRGRYVARVGESPPQYGLPPRCGDDTSHEQIAGRVKTVYPRDAGTIPIPDVLDSLCIRFTPAMRGRYRGCHRSRDGCTGLPPRCGDDTRP